jgi:hypothetical protein
MLIQRVVAVKPCFERIGALNNIDINRVKPETRIQLMLGNYTHTGTPIHFSDVCRDAGFFPSENNTCQTLLLLDEKLYAALRGDFD